MVTSEAGAPDWAPIPRLTFRFVCAYFLLYTFPFPLTVVPFNWKTLSPAGIWPLIEPYGKMWNAIVPWVGKHVLHLSYDITVLPPNGGGDSTFHYVQFLCFLVLAAAATVIWTLADRRRTNYTKLHEWLRLYVRYSLAVTLLTYGAFKVIKSQFQFPGLERLVGTYGDSSPMGLLWTFMGYSVPYNVFTGGGEILAGLLLFSRRLTTLGALVSIGVLSNVLMLNFSYDVDVKLFSMNLLAMAVFLLAPDVRRLADLLVLNRSVAPAETQALFAARWMNRAGAGVKTVFLAYVLFTKLNESRDLRALYGDLSPRSPLYGIYDVETFIRNGDTVPPLLTDSARWRRVIFDGPRSASIRLMSDTPQRYTVTLDPEGKTLQLSSSLASTNKILLAYLRPDKDHLILQGMHGDDSIRVMLRRIDESKFLLVSQGFHWVKEFPLNR